MSVEKTLICSRCDQPKTTAEMAPAKRLRAGHYRHCRQCHYQRRNELRAKNRRPRREVRGKLPPYATLKALYCEKGWSYADIAGKYDVWRSTVTRTMRQRARAYGDPWPLPTRMSRSEKISRAERRHSVNPRLIIILVWDHLRELEPTYAAWKAWAIASCEERTRRHHITNCPCTRIARADPFRLALEDFCRRTRMSPAYLREIRAGTVTSITDEYARRLLLAIGEDVDPDLVKPPRNPKYAGRRRACRSNAPTANKPQLVSTTPVPDAGLPLSEAS